MIDNDWAGSAEETARAAMDADSLRGTTMNVNECRSSLCKLEVVHDSDEDQSQFEGTVYRVKNHDSIALVYMTDCSIGAPPR